PGPPEGGGRSRTRSHRGAKSDPTPPGASCGRARAPLGGCRAVPAHRSVFASRAWLGRHIRPTLPQSLVSIEPISPRGATRIIVCRAFARTLNLDDEKFSSPVALYRRPRARYPARRLRHVVGSEGGVRNGVAQQGPERLPRGARQLSRRGQAFARFGRSAASARGDRGDPRRVRSGAERLPGGGSALPFPEDLASRGPHGRPDG